MAGLLEGKKALVLGVADHWSIAWGITQALHNHGATLGLSYQGATVEKRVLPLATEIGAIFAQPCDVTKPGDIAALMARAEKEFGRIDILVHSIAYAPGTAFDKPFHQITWEEFATAMRASVYSLIEVTNTALPLMKDGASVMTITHHGSQQVFPGYGPMAVAKNALEAVVRYLAADPGVKPNIRVNGISSGPIKTLAARRIPNFMDYLEQFAEMAPLGRKIEPADVGNMAVFLASGLSSAITGQILYVDGGASTVAIKAKDAKGPAQPQMPSQTA